MQKKVTTKKKKEINVEFKVRKISNGYLMTIWDTVNYDDDKLIYCVTREDVLSVISGLVF